MSFIVNGLMSSLACFFRGGGGGGRECGQCDRMGRVEGAFWVKKYIPIIRKKVNTLMKKIDIYFNFTLKLGQ